MRIASISVFFIALLFVQVAFGQATGKSYPGTVKDANGALVPGVADGDK